MQKFDITFWEVERPLSKLLQMINAIAISYVWRTKYLVLLNLCQKKCSHENEYSHSEQVILHLYSGWTLSKAMYSLADL